MLLYRNAPCYPLTTAPQGWHAQNGVMGVLRGPRPSQTQGVPPGILFAPLAPLRETRHVLRRAPFEMRQEQRNIRRRDPRDPARLGEAHRPDAQEFFAGFGAKMN